MEMRAFGRTGMQLSVLGFGCGAVGGLMVRGDPLDQERTIARAIAAGVNYFDTAVQYGNGESEKNLGRILQRLKPGNVAVGTKVRLPSGDFGRIAEAADYWWMTTRVNQTADLTDRCAEHRPRRRREPLL